jgi:serine/threonine protein kinase
LSALLHIQANNIFHGDLRPWNVFLSNGGGFKIVDHGLVTYGRSAVLDAMHRDPREERGFLAPKSLRDVKARRSDGPFEKYKGNIFALGLILLETATFTQSGQYYD